MLIFPGFQLLDAAGPISVFEIGARLAGQPPSIRPMAVTSGPVRSSSGAEMVARGYAQDFAERCARTARSRHRQRLRDGR